MGFQGTWNEFIVPFKIPFLRPQGILARGGSRSLRCLFGAGHGGDRGVELKGSAAVVHVFLG